MLKLVKSLKSKEVKMSKTNNKKAVNLYEGASSGGGLEEVTSDDIQIPFLIYRF